MSAACAAPGCQAQAYAWHLRVRLEEANLRLDRVLQRRLQLSRRQVAALCAAGVHRCPTASPLPPHARLRAGEWLHFKAQLVTTAAPMPEPALPLDLRYEDAHLLVVAKPAGMPSHALDAGQTGTLAAALIAFDARLAAVAPRPCDAGLVHRLDVGTSGLLLVARSAAVHAQLGVQTRAGAITKGYTALVHGLVRAPQMLHYALAARRRQAAVGVLASADPAAPGPALKLGRRSAAGPLTCRRPRDLRRPVPATTAVVAAQPLAAHTLLQLRIVRGYRHQIRAHLSALGCPIVGDLLYGGQATPVLDGHFLHAHTLRLMHPVTGQPLSFCCDLPADRQALLEGLRRPVRHFR
ncbi:MAG: RluA family pseudouridine synthase [Polyangiales bacterium]